MAEHTESAADSGPESAEDNGPQSLLEHLLELRSRLLKASLAVLVILIALSPFSRRLFDWLAVPMLSQLPEGSQLIAVDVAAPFLTPFKLTLVIALLLAMPVILYQIWAFVAPGLYRHEKRLAMPILISSVLLFYAGCAFAFFVVFPLLFGFFFNIAPDAVSVTPDIAAYLSFILTLFIAFGLAFEVPVVTLILVSTGVMSRQQLAAKRGYIIVGAFAVGMLLTPPDVISQTLLALPVWLLFELGLLMCRWLVPEKRGEGPDEA